MSGDSDSESADLSDEHIEAIVRTLARAHDDRITCKVIVGMTVKGPGRVSVDTGFVRGPLNGEGDAIELVKEGGAWRVVSVTWWIS